MKSNKIKMWALVAFLVISVCYAGITVSRILCCTQLQDFTVYYQATVRVIQQLDPYYQRIYIYPPSSLLFFLPFTLFSLGVAQDIWTVVSVVALISGITCLFLSVGKKLQSVTVLVVFSFAMLAFPTKFTLGLGQINLLLFGLIALDFYLFQQKRTTLTGIILALVVAIKLTPILLLFFFLRKKQWSVLISFGFCSVFLVAMGSYAFGWQRTMQYWNDVFPHLPTVGNAVYYNQALTGLLARSGIASSLASPINTIVTVGLLILSYFLMLPQRQKSVHEMLEFSLWIIIALIGGGLAWQHHLVVLIIPFFATAAWLIREKKVISSPGAIWMLAYLLIAFNSKQPQSIANLSTLPLSHGLFGMILLFGLVVYQLRCYACHKRSASL